MEFLRWIGNGIWTATATVWERFWRGTDAAEARQDAITHQWSDLNTVLTRQVERHGEQIKVLVQQNCDQAAEMKNLNLQIEQCREHHEQCERDRDHFAAQLAAVTTKVSSIETKLPPEST